MATLNKTYPIKVTKFPIESVIYLQPAKIQSLGTFLCKVCLAPEVAQLLQLKVSQVTKASSPQLTKTLSWVVSMLESV